MSFSIFYSALILIRSFIPGNGIQITKAIKLPSPVFGRGVGGEGLLSMLKKSKPRRRIHRYGALFIVSHLGFTSSYLFAQPPAPYPLIITPGTPAENRILRKSEGSIAVDGARKAEIGQFWIWNLPVVAGANCKLTLKMDGDAGAPEPVVTALDAAEKPIFVQMHRETEGSFTVEWIVPDKWPAGLSMGVIISAKTGAITVKQASFLVTETDKNGDGLADSISKLMTMGMPPGTRPQVFPYPSQPYTTTQLPNAPDPTLDPQTDAVFAYTTAEDAIKGWKARGCAVWTMGGSRDGKEYADKHPDAVQTDHNGHPITIDNSYYLAPTADRIARENSYYSTAIDRGSMGVCPEEPEYFARAGYEDSFKLAWQKQYGSPWQDPASSIDNRWRAGQLMGDLETNHIDSVLRAAGQKMPAIRKMVALHSPLNYAWWNIIAPQAKISSLPEVQDVIGQVWTGTARTPARYAGLRIDRTFPVAYLEYSSLYQLMRGTGKRLWFLMDPLEDNPNLSQTDYKSHYEQTLIASLLFPGVDAYEVMPWPQRVYGHIPPEYATQINGVIAALQDMNNQTSSNAGESDGIGVFVSDSMQYQRESPSGSDFDGVLGLTLPLLQRGVPVQLVSLDRAADPGYLRPFKTLLLSYDFQKPPSARIQEALINWVRNGGSLLFFGGSDAYNGLAASWWNQAKLKSPQEAIWNQLSISPGAASEIKAAKSDSTQTFTTIAVNSGFGAAHGESKQIVVDLTRFVQSSGSVVVRLKDRTPQDGLGAQLKTTELRIDGKIALSFQTGTEMENRFLVHDDNSQFNSSGRFADKNASFTYQFDNLPKNRPILLSLILSNDFEVSATAVQQDYSRTLIAGTESGALAAAFPRLKIGPEYAVTSFHLSVQAAALTKKSPEKKTISGPGQKSLNRGTSSNSGPVPLYTLRSGTAPLWVASVGSGLFLNVGIAPGFFSASERSAAFLRALTQYAQQRAGGTYREPGYLRQRRGKYTVVGTFGKSVTVEGRTINLLSSDLDVSLDRRIPPHSLALLYDLGPGSAAPHIGFVAGRLMAKIETEQNTILAVRAPLNTPGATRLHSGGRKITGARAMDRFGQSVPVQIVEEGGSVLLKYPNDPDGVILRVGWQSG